MYKGEKMKEAIYNWLEQLACYLILVTAVLHALPDSGYKKYIRFFTGLILVLLLASPVLQLFQTDVDRWMNDPEENYREWTEKDVYKRQVLCTATASEKPREGIDFFPLSVEYNERLYAVGKIPGGFNKREGKASENAILTCRVIDRCV